MTTLKQTQGTVLKVKMDGMNIQSKVKLSEVNVRLCKRIRFHSWDIKIIRKRGNLGEG